MLLKRTASKLENMQVSKIPQMCLFHTSIQDNTITVSYWSPESKSITHKLDIPLEPPIANLPTLDVEMYSSTLHSYEMGAPYNDWFSARFGFPVVLAYWGGNTRPVLGNRPGRPANELPAPPTLTASMVRKIPIIGTKLFPEDESIAFNDVAPYLVVSEESNKNASARLPAGVDMEIDKFRGNIVVRSGCEAYDEDFWAELTFASAAKLILTANCVRCVSLVVDYETGKSGTGKAKDVFRLLSKDRRVDAGSKWSPVFGRYGFVEKKDEGQQLRVGESVTVSARNKERTTFCKCSARGGYSDMSLFEYSMAGAIEAGSTILGLCNGRKYTCERVSYVQNIKSTKFNVYDGRMRHSSYDCNPEM